MNKDEFIVKLKKSVLYERSCYEDAAARIAELEAALAASQAECERLREASRWVPVTERLPEKSDEWGFEYPQCLVTCGPEGDEIVTDGYIASEGQYEGQWVEYKNYEKRPLKNVLAWREYPQAYESEA